MLERTSRLPAPPIAERHPKVSVWHGVALKDDYFIQRKLYPNVDFYSGIIYKALGIPTEMFTVMFAIARTAGWVAHWLEQNVTPDTKIGRPRQVYTGAAPRDYVAIDKR